MKSKLLIPIVVAVVAVAGVGFFVMSKDDSESSDTSNSTSKESTDSSNSESKTSSTSPKLPEQTVGQQPDCSLYTLEDMAGVWGVPMTDTDVDGSKVSQISGPQNYQYECDYNETDSGLGLTVTIQHKVYEDEAAAKTSIQNTRDGAKFGETVYFVQDDVDGIGDEAFFSLPARQVDNPDNVQQQLYARDRNVVYLISATNLDGAKPDYRDKILETYRLKLGSL